MTQEELNELIDGNFDEEVQEETSSDDNKASEDNVAYDETQYKMGHQKWPPPPPTSEHKVVHQLDDVTKGLEAKAAQVFDQLESISQNSESVQKDLRIIKNHIETQKKIFEKLSVQFPQVNAFKESLESCSDSLQRITSVDEKTTDISDCILQAMDIMQYQDIYRQKIERVVNVTRALSKYLNSIFDTDVEDEKRVASASYISGDTKEDVASNDEIEALIASLGKK